MMKILVTGAAGFIGYHLVRALHSDTNNIIIGIDNLNDYYDPRLKLARLTNLKNLARFHFIRTDLADRQSMEQLFSQHQFDRVIHLAAQAGVRYSLQNPHVYAHSNLVGFLHILEGCRQQDIKHLIFASSSSVYGANGKYPFSESDNVDHPVSLYAASKKANELMAHSYAKLYHIPCTGLRFFTVYGPWGRPDMAVFKFTRRILENKPIEVYNHGDMYRDFTYIDDIIAGMMRIITKPASSNPAWTNQHPDPATSNAPYRIYNIGNGHPVKLTDFIGELEKQLGKQAIKQWLPIQPGDVYKTYADITQLKHDFNYQPKTPLQEGIKEFIDWYRQYYQLKNDPIKQPQQLQKI